MTRSPLFLLGLALRIALLPFFGSYYLRDLFIPFVDSAILNPGRNPWELSAPQFFPYGSVQFAIVFPLKWVGYHLWGDAALGQTALSVALMKAAILPFDVLLYRALASWPGTQGGRLVLLYWLNPLVIYVTYIYGQIDLTSMFFAVSAIIALSSGRVVLSAFSMAAALLCKFHVAAIVPILVIYIWNNNFIRPALRKISTWSALTFGVAVAGFLPLLTADKFFYATAMSPEAGRVLSLAVDFGSGRRLYLGLFLVLAVIGRLVIATRITSQGLFYGCALVFGSLLLVTNPFPGWYLWVVPFMTVFFATYTNITPLVFSLFCVLHVVYFALVEPLSAPGGIAAGIGFTLVQTTLAGILVALYAIVIREEVPIQGRTRPLWIGVAGDSATGKSTLAGILDDLFGGRDTVVLAGDDYHRWERSHPQWENYTHLHPRANRLLRLEEHARDLDRGVAVHHPAYDHQTGTFTTPRRIVPSKTVIVHGLHTFYLKHARASYDLRIFLEPEANLRVAWKVQRDSTERGVGIADVIDSLAEREGDSRAHILPQREFADWIIEYHARAPLSAEHITSAAPIALGVRHVLWNDAPVMSICQRLSELPGFSISYGAGAVAADRIVLDMDGEPSATQIREIAQQFFPTLRHITRTSSPPRFRPGLQGVTQLLCLALLGAKLGSLEAHFAEVPAT